MRHLLRMKFSTDWQIWTKRWLRNAHLAPFRPARIDLAMSISVTHEGMETLASDYVRDLISRHLKLRHLRVSF